ncbi:MAG: ComF family protein [Gammaproteobacteria bacterium]|nr:ComF family protein [Gammaproteobacteria bacterium]
MCYKNLPIVAQACPQCAQILPNKIQSQHCGTCLSNPPPFDHAFTLFPYEEPIALLLMALKFSGALHHAQLFGELLTQKIRLSWYHQLALPDLIIPMPLHQDRLKKRGFNQALEIARPVSKQLKIPLDLTGLIRHKATQPQTFLKARARRANVARAFLARSHYHNLTIAVLDDIITTTETLRACCRVLKLKGAKSIHVWSVARR